MALDRLWKLYASETNAASDTMGESVWLAFDPRSSLVSLPSQILGDRQPEQTVTVRMRYRTDVTLQSAFTGEGKVWNVDQILQVGRRQWLDVVVTSYAAAPAVMPSMPDGATWPPAPDSGPQQTGYTLGYRELSVSSFVRHQRPRPSDNPQIDLWIGVRCTNPDSRTGVVPQRLIVGARNSSGGDVWFDCYARRNSAGNLRATDGFRVRSDETVFPNNNSVVNLESRWWMWNVYSSQTPQLSVGMRVYVLTAAEVTALPPGSV